MEYYQLDALYDLVMGDNDLYIFFQIYPEMFKLLYSSVKANIK